MIAGEDCEVPNDGEVKDYVEDGGVMSVVFDDPIQMQSYGV